MYYAVLSFAVLLLGVQFLFDQKFQQKNGIGFTISMIAALGQSLFGLPIIWATAGFRLDYTNFTFIMAFINAINTMFGAYFAINALAYTNLSLYSVFTMLGGMVLPFISGVLFFNESLSLGKIVCFLGVALAIGVTYKRDGKNKGLVFCIGNFLVNGFAGVLSKIFQALPYEKTDSSGYLLLTCIIIVVLSLIILLISHKNLSLPGKASVIFLAGSGISNRLANLLMLIALLHLPVSVQYPMVTGGVMIVSTILGYFTDKKPGKREIISVALAFLSIIALIVL